MYNIFYFTYYFFLHCLSKIFLNHLTLKGICTQNFTDNSSQYFGYKSLLKINDLEIFLIYKNKNSIYFYTHIIFYILHTKRKNERERVRERYHQTCNFWNDTLWKHRSTWTPVSFYHFCNPINRHNNLLKLSTPFKQIFNDQIRNHKIYIKYTSNLHKIYIKYT